MQFLVLYKTLLALPYSSPAFYTKLETPTIFGHHFFLFIFPFPFSFSISCSFYCLYCLLHFFLFPFYSHKKLVQVQKREKKQGTMCTKVQGKVDVACPDGPLPPPHRQAVAMQPPPPNLLLPQLPKDPSAMQLRVGPTRRTCSPTQWHKRRSMCSRPRRCREGAMVAVVDRRGDRAEEGRGKRGIKRIRELES